MRQRNAHKAVPLPQIHCFYTTLHIEAFLNPPCAADKEQLLANRLAAYVVHRVDILKYQQVQNFATLDFFAWSSRKVSMLQLNKHFLDAA